MMLTGRCLCGRIQYEVEGPLPPLVNCHCQFCRRAHGAAFVTVTWISSSSFHITSGENSVHRHEVGVGFRGFCGSCGTRLYNGLNRGGGVITLIVSTLDACPLGGPVMHINVESKADWYSISDDLPQYQSRPLDMAATLKSLQSRSEQTPG